MNILIQIWMLNVLILHCKAAFINIALLRKCIEASKCDDSRSLFFGGAAILHTSVIPGIYHKLPLKSPVKELLANLFFFKQTNDKYFLIDDTLNSPLFLGCAVKALRRSHFTVSEFLELFFAVPILPTQRTIFHENWTIIRSTIMEDSRNKWKLNAGIFRQFLRINFNILAAFSDKVILALFWFCSILDEFRHAGDGGHLREMLAHILTGYILSSSSCPKIFLDLVQNGNSEDFPVNYNEPSITLDHIHLVSFFPGFRNQYFTLDPEPPKLPKEISLAILSMLAAVFWNPFRGDFDWKSSPGLLRSWPSKACLGFFRKKIKGFDQLLGLFYSGEKYDSLFEKKVQFDSLSITQNLLIESILFRTFHYLAGSHFHSEWLNFSKYSTNDHLKIRFSRSESHLVQYKFLFHYSEICQFQYLLVINGSLTSFEFSGIHMAPFNEQLPVVIYNYLQPILENKSFVVPQCPLVDYLAGELSNLDFIIESRNIDFLNNPLLALAIFNRYKKIDDRLWNDPNSNDENRTKLFDFMVDCFSKIQRKYFDHDMDRLFSRLKMFSWDRAQNILSRHFDFIKVRMNFFRQQTTIFSLLHEFTLLDQFLMNWNDKICISNFHLSFLNHDLLQILRKNGALSLNFISKRSLRLSKLVQNSIKLLENPLTLAENSAADFDSMVIECGYPNDFEVAIEIFKKFRPKISYIFLDCEQKFKEFIRSAEMDICLEFMEKAEDFLRNDGIFLLQNIMKKVNQFEGDIGDLLIDLKQSLMNDGFIVKFRPEAPIILRRKIIEKIIKHPKVAEVVLESLVPLAGLDLTKTTWKLNLEFAEEIRELFKTNNFSNSKVIIRRPMNCAYLWSVLEGKIFKELEISLSGLLDENDRNSIIPHIQIQECLKLLITEIDLRIDDFILFLKELFRSKIVKKRLFVQVSLKYENGLFDFHQDLLSEASKAGLTEFSISTDLEDFIIL